MNVNELQSELDTLSTRELKERFALCYGHTPTTKNRSHLIRKILWAHQRDAYGDVSKTARKKALAIADDRDAKERFPQVERPCTDKPKTQALTIAYRPEPNLLPGTVLNRNYQGRDIRVLTLENGFEWNGEVYKSLSAVARAVTGTRWNGKLFFGLKKKGGAQ